MAAGPAFFTPNEMFTRAPLGAISRAEVPGPQFKGRIGVVTHSAGSTGGFVVGGYPIDVYPIVVRVAVAGDLGVAQIEVSTDAGVTYGDPVLTEGQRYNVPGAPTWNYEIGITGVTLQLTNGSGTPNSFLAGDTWSFTTTASDKLLQICAEVSDLWRKWAQDTAQTITTPDAADLRFMANIARVHAVSDRGDVPDTWWKLYDEAMRHFDLEAKGDIKLNSVPDPDGFVFPDYERARCPWRVPLINLMH